MGFEVTCRRCQGRGEYVTTYFQGPEGFDFAEETVSCEKCGGRGYTRTMVDPNERDPILFRKRKKERVDERCAK